MNENEQAGALDRQATVDLLNRHGIRPDRKLGQNFLVDPTAAERIAQGSGAETGDAAIEVGPGIGALTRQLAVRAGHVTAFEIDEGLRPALEESLSDCSNVDVVFEDFLKADLSGFRNQTVRVAANVPYYITTPILRRILTSFPECPSLVLLVQREAADRILAQPGSRQYGPVSVLLKALFDARPAFRLSPGAFYPRPTVESTVIQAVRRDTVLPDGFSADDFLTLLDAAFAHRRKRLRNTLILSGKLSEEQVVRIPAAMDGAGLDDSVRAEAVEPDSFLALWAGL